MKYIFDLNSFYVLRQADDNASGQDVFNDVNSGINQNQLYFMENIGVTGYQYKIINNAIVSAPAQKYIYSIDSNSFVSNFICQNYWNDIIGENQLWIDSKLWSNSDLINNNGVKKYRALTSITWEARTQSEMDIEFYSESAIQEFQKEIALWNQLNYDREIVRAFVAQQLFKLPLLTKQFIDIFETSNNMDIPNCTNMTYDSVNKCLYATNFGLAVSWRTKALSASGTKCAVILIGDFVLNGFIPTVKISNNGGSSWITCTFSESARYSDQMTISILPGNFIIKVDANPPADLATGGIPYAVSFGLIYI